uniref:Uncharacterized protein n=1 Tax=Romanomermis culicivorax TaxID=13658 RepID=A0A915K305_ROMCU
CRRLKKLIRHFEQNRIAILEKESGCHIGYYPVIQCQLNTSWGFSLTDSEYNWQTVWSTAKSFYEKINPNLGHGEKVKYGGLFNNAAAFVEKLKQNPNELIDAAKSLYAKAMASQNPSVDPERVRQLQADSHNLKQASSRAKKQMKFSTPKATNVKNANTKSSVKTHHSSASDRSYICSQITIS